jgi:hypothetical protein
MSDGEGSAERILLTEPTISADWVGDVPIAANDDRPGKVCYCIPDVQMEGAAHSARVYGHLDYSTPQPRR